MAEIENEFSDAFSTAFDGEGVESSLGLCSPPVDWTCFGDSDKVAALDPSKKQLAEVLAWNTLAALTGDQVATCPVTVRPCNEGCRDGGSPYLAAPVGMSGHYAGVRSFFTPHVGASGAWVNGCGCASGDCSCSRLCEVILPGPVGGIEEVWLDGSVISPSAYRVDNGNRLVRTDGGCWPSCQDMSQGAHGEDAFSVTYYRGVAPDALTSWCAGLLAAEYYKACSGQACKLPAGVQQISRQGISMIINQDMFGVGGTGIREVDALVARLNPYHLRSAPVIATPQTRRARTTTFGRW